MINFIRMKNFKLIIISLIFSMISVLHSQQSNNIIIVNAKVSKVNYVSNDSRLLDDGTMILSSDVMNITFKKPKLVRGELDVNLPSKLTFDIGLNSKTRDLKKQTFSLLIEFIDDKNYRLLDWSFISSVACFNGGNMDSVDKKYYFKMDFEDDYYDSNDFCALLNQ